MSARVALVVAAMVNDDYDALERMLDGIGRPKIGRHILVARLRAGQRAVHGIDDDAARLDRLRLDVRYKLMMVLDEVQASAAEIEQRHRLAGAKTPLSSLSVRRSP